MGRSDKALPQEEGSPMMNFRTIKVKVRFIVEPDEGRFHVYCPELKGLHVDGATEEEAFENASRAAELHIMSIIRHNDPLPVGSQDTTVSLGDLFKRAVCALAGKPHTRIQELSIAA